MGAYDMHVEQGWGEEEAPAPDRADWLRVPAGQPRAVVVLSAEPSRYAGHWHPPSRRFRRCSLPDTGRCAQCASGVGRQKRFVVAVLDEAGVQWLWEFGPPQAAPIRALLHGGRALRGLALVLSRPPSPAGHQPICVMAAGPGDAAGPGEAGASLPEPVDVAALLWGTWIRQALKNGKDAEMFAGRPAGAAAVTAAALSGAALSAPPPPPAKPAPGPPAAQPTDGPRTRRLYAALVRRHGEREGEQEDKEEDKGPPPPCSRCGEVG